MLEVKKSIPRPLGKFCCKNKLCAENSHLFQSGEIRCCERVLPLLRFDVLCEERGAAECALLCLQPVPSRGLRRSERGRCASCAVASSFYGINDVVLAAHLFTVHRRKTIKYERGEGGRVEKWAKRAFFHKTILSLSTFVSPHPIRRLVCAHVLDFTAND